MRILILAHAFSTPVIIICKSCIFKSFLIWSFFTADHVEAWEKLMNIFVN